MSIFAVPGPPFPRTGVYGLMSTPSSFSPLNLGSSLKLWLNADLGITTVSGMVSQWNDQSGNGAHFQQTTAANRPLYGTLASSGKAAVVGQDSTDSMVCPAATKAATYWRFLHDGNGCTIATAFETSNTGSQTVFSTLRTTNTRTGVDLTYNGGTTQESLIIGNGSGTYVISLSTTGGSSPLGFRRRVDSFATSDSPDARIRRNGTEIGTANQAATPATGNAFGDPTILALTLGGGVLIGGLRHVIIADRLLTAGELAGLESYLLT